MSSKDNFFPRIDSATILVRSVALAIVLCVNAVAVSQQPTPAPPLAGGFMIDFGDDTDADRANPKQLERSDRRSADEIVRSLMKSEAARVDAVEGATPGENSAAISGADFDSPAIRSANTPTATPAATPQNAVRGLPPTSLPMAFPAAAPQSGSNKGTATLLQAGDMIGFSRELGDGVQAITIINASRRWMAVYHIDASGQIRLTSSRPLDADFTIQFNATAPLPEDIRRLQGR